MSCRVVIRKYWIEFLRFLLLIQCKDGGLSKARRRRRSVVGVIIFNQKEQNTLHCMSCYGSPWRARVVNFTAFTKTLYMRRRQNEKLQVLSQQRRGLEILKQFHDSHLSHFFPTGLTEPSVCSAGNLAGFNCEAQARVRQGKARKGKKRQGWRKVKGLKA